MTEAFVAEQINKIWYDRICRWQAILLDIAYVTMTDYNTSKVKMVLNDISDIKVREFDMKRLPLSDENTAHGEDK